MRKRYFRYYLPNYVFMAQSRQQFHFSSNLPREMFTSRIERDTFYGIETPIQLVSNLTENQSYGT